MTDKNIKKSITFLNELKEQSKLENKAIYFQNQEATFEIELETSSVSVFFVEDRVTELVFLFQLGVILKDFSVKKKD